MQSLLRKIAAYTYKPFIQWKTAYPSTYRYKNIQLQIPPGIFHPAYFNSTLFLLQYVESLQLENKKLVELGCGSGLISCVAASNKAIVTASDINPLAIITLQKNAHGNNLEMKIIESDLFDNLKDSDFDIIVINPPYYPKNPKSAADYAWYCGAEFEYFKKLFSQLSKHTSTLSEIYIVLSDDCDLERIRLIAKENNLVLNVISEKKFWNGKEKIYSITQMS